MTISLLCLEIKNTISDKHICALESFFKKTISIIAPQAKVRHLIHGDYGFSNLLVDKKTGNISAILDWEELRWDAPIFDIAGVVEFYEMGLPGGKSLFLYEYIKATKQLNHSNFKEIKQAIDNIDKFIFVAQYYELNLMIENKINEPQYFEEILDYLFSWKSE